MWLTCERRRQRLLLFWQLLLLARLESYSCSSDGHRCGPARTAGGQRRVQTPRGRRLLGAARGTARASRAISRIFQICGLAAPSPRRCEFAATSVLLEPSPECISWLCRESRLACIFFLTYSLVHRTCRVPQLMLVILTQDSIVFRFESEFSGVRTMMLA